VYAESYWELARHTRLHTRVDLDIDMDANGSFTEMELVDGGITHVGSAYEEAAWPSRIDRSHGVEQAHYFDFLVEIPNVTGGSGSAGLGIVGYEDYLLFIDEDGYELWDQSDPYNYVSLGSYSASTAGLRNIGIRAGTNSGVWVDGQKIITATLPARDQPVVRFMARLPIIFNGGADGPLILRDNLIYVKSWNRTQDDGNPSGSGGIPGDYAPRVVVTTFDGPAPVTMQEVPPSGSPDVFINYEEDSTRWREFMPGGKDRVFTGLPNGRRGTAHIVTENADERVRDESGLKKSPYGPLPGVAITVIHDAVGGTKSYTSVPKFGGTVVDSYNELDPELMQPGALYNLCSMTLRPGGSEPTIAGGAATANPGPAGQPDTGNPLSAANADNGTCACRDNDPSEPIPMASVDTPTGALHDHMGRFVDANPDIVFNIDARHFDDLTPGFIDLGITSFNPQEVWDLLNDATKRRWRRISSLGEGCGWAIVFEGSIASPVGIRRGEGGFTNAAAEGIRGRAEVKSKEWIRAAEDGRDVQWEDDSWGVDFTNRRIYIDTSSNKRAAETFSRLVEFLSCDRRGDFRGVNLHKSLGGRNPNSPGPRVGAILQRLLREEGIGGGDVAFWARLSPREQRLVSQVAHFESKGDAALIESWLITRGLAIPAGAGIAKAIALLRALLRAQLRIERMRNQGRADDAQEQIPRD